MLNAVKLIHDDSKKKAKAHLEAKESENEEIQSLKDELFKTTEQLNILKKLWKDREIQFDKLQNEANQLKQQNKVLQLKQIKHDVITNDLSNQLSVAQTENSKVMEQLKALQQIRIKEKKVLIEEVKKLRNIKSNLSEKYKTERNLNDDLLIQFEQKESEQKSDMQRLQHTALQTQTKYENEMKDLSDQYQQLNKKLTETKKKQVKLGKITFMGVWKDEKQRAMSNTLGRFDCIETPILLFREEMLKQHISTGYFAIQDGNCIFYDFENSTYQKYGQIEQNKARINQNIHVIGFEGKIDVIGNGWMNAVYKIHVVLDTPGGNNNDVKIYKLHQRKKFDALNKYKVRLKNKTFNKYITCLSNGKVKCNKKKRCDETIFYSIPLSNNLVAIQSGDGVYLSVDNDGCMEGLYVDDKSKLFKQQKFKVLENSKEGLYYGFQSFYTGKYISARKNGDILVDKDWCKGWESWIVEIQ